MLYEQGEEVKTAVFISSDEDASATTYSRISTFHKKLVIAGDSVGKTSLLLVQSGQPFSPEYLPTIFENYVSNVDIGKKRRIELSLWDTAGQEDYDRLRPLSYPDTDVVLLVFSFDNRISYDNILEKWYPEVHHFLPDVPIILVGTKKDLKDDSEAIAEMARRTMTMVTTEDGIVLKEEIKAARYFEVSAKTGEGVPELFRAASKVAFRHRNPKKCVIQ